MINEPTAASLAYGE
ncbi:MAG: hypothetical protein J7D60_11090 [Prosthecochloris sp.]|nr:hypothetical protein [Prosthecochloris sp.]